MRDLGDDAGYATLTEAERTAVLVWVLDSSVRGGGVQGWIEGYGPRSTDVVAALRLLGAAVHAELFEENVSLYPTREAADEDERLSCVDAWTQETDARSRDLEARLLQAMKADDLIDVYVRPFIEARPEEFPQTVNDL